MLAAIGHASTAIAAYNKVLANLHPIINKTLKNDAILLQTQTGEKIVSDLLHLKDQVWFSRLKVNDIHRKRISLADTCDTLQKRIKVYLKEEDEKRKLEQAEKESKIKKRKRTTKKSSTTH